MRKTTSWVATLALAAVPAVTQAGPFGLFGGSKPEAASSPTQSADAVAQNIAEAMRAAKLQGRDINIEFTRGTATLSGIIADPTQKARATQAASHVEGVEAVVNNMRVAGPSAAAAARTAAPRSAIRQVSNEVPAIASRPTEMAPRLARTPEVRQVSSQFEEPANDVAPQGPSNQEMAQKVATALSEQNLTGYDIQIRYQNGIATLGGSIASRQQWQRASLAASEVPGVDRVLNRMTVGTPQEEAAPQQMPQRTASRGPQGYPPQGYPQQGPPQQGYPQQGYPQQQMMNRGVPVQRVGYRQDPPMPAGPGAPGGQMGPPPGWQPPQPPQAYGHPGGGMAHQAYSSPNLPEYAWPAQAAYPNSAQISYPQQYSASAWPYIGPFYPYPQVPLGWREAQLEWDDGYWHLNFKPRTSKWFWFANPRNWN